MSAILSHAQRMKIFSFRKIYALHFLSQVDYVRSSELPYHRSEAIYSLKRSSLKRSLTHVRFPASIRYCRDEPKILSNLAWIPDEIPRRYFLYFMSSQPFHAQDPRNFDKKNTLRATSCAKNRAKRPFRKNSSINCTCTLQHPFLFIFLFTYIFIWYLISKIDVIL